MSEIDSENTDYDENDEDLKLHVSDVQTEDLYFNLEEVLSPLKPNGIQDGYRIRKGEKQIGIIEAPQWAHGTIEITAEEFRGHFHEIMDSLESDDESTSYTILVDNEPAGCLMSKMKHLKNMSLAANILKKHFKQENPKIKRIRSWFSGLFRQRSDK